MLPLVPSVAQVVLPLAVGLLLAVVTGKAAESGYLVTGGGAVFWTARACRCCWPAPSGP
ncbi:hypothetical protein [Streptomyces sp. NBC_00557]|uniref:hypothetical protein n=1 Tax=Streptomyces sp. NBC_00557 TaxID=2975776 RepID=UPI002E811606|nr:hypothetical protein [Streptomyces sp. NBC_00557]